MRLATACNIADLRTLAQRRLPRLVRDYLEGGAEDGLSLQANRDAFAAVRLLPRSLVNVAGRSLHTTLFGQRWDAPFGIAPMGACGLAWHQADAALARAARAANLPLALSTHAFMRAPQVAQAAGSAPWFQLYMSPERPRTLALLAEAAQAGCDTLVLTTDVPVGGNREYNDRNGFSIPIRPNLAALVDVLAHPRWLAGVYLRSGLLATAQAAAQSGWSERRDTLDWRDFLWLRQAWKGRLLVKGILHPEDAAAAAELGADGIVVSNHGGRQLDGAPAPLQMLPAICATVRGRIPVLLDGGIRRGSDIAKALALGASFVLVGRAVLYGLAAGGEGGARRALQMLARELDRTLALLGCRSPADLGRHCLWQPEEAAPGMRRLRLAARSESQARVLPLRRTRPPDPERPRPH